MLERATIVDTANHWSHGTMKAYQSKARVLHQFEADFRITVLPPPQMAHPPDGVARLLMWAQQRYSLYPARWRRHQSEAPSTVKFGTVRGLRSAAAFQNTINWMQSRLDNVTVGLKNQPLMVPRCNPTDEMSFTYFTDGMRRRLGDKSNPSDVLLDQHITWIDNHLREVFRSTDDEDVITNLLAWLAWLRAVETFTVRWGGLQLVRPVNGPEEGLPVGLGVIKLDLQKQTKSSQERTVDMIIAYTTASDKSLGWWFEELQVLTPYPARGPDCFIVVGPIVLSCAMPTVLHGRLIISATRMCILSSVCNVRLAIATWPSSTSPRVRA
jgi:hypothetical protein